jgi:hypothetical protein
MHRSGTSSVAGALTILGVSPPAHVVAGDRWNEKGYWESLPIMKFHDELLVSAGSSWNDWSEIDSAWYETPAAADWRHKAEELLHSEFNGQASFVMKDPRICRFVRFWLEVFDSCDLEPRIVIPVRNPLEVARSLEDRDKLPINLGLLMWLRHCLDAEVGSRGRSRAFLDWSEFISDWRLSVFRMGQLLRVEWPRLPDRTAELDGFLDATMRHHKIDLDVLRADPEIHDWFISVYEALCILVQQPYSNAAMATIDEVRSQFDEYVQLFEL